MKTYEDGLNEAWEAARKIVEMGEYDRKYVVFDRLGDGEFPFEKYSASEAIDAIKKHEGFNVGDEVTDNDGWKGVVTHISSDGEYLLVVLRDGNAIRWEKEHFKKTGRHFPQIAEVLKQMQEGEAKWTHGA